MAKKVDTIIVGAGQAGLSLSRYLSRGGQRHVVLERGRIGQSWHDRWDSLRLLTPNWLNRLDGGAAHRDPDGFLSRADFVKYLRRYARFNGAPVYEHTAVKSVEQWDDGFQLETDAGAFRARNVVVATGDQAAPRIPAVAASAPYALRQLHADRYRSPGALASGGVLVVGAGPSGQQIAAELHRAGRHVVLAAGSHARSQRRYRGRDIWYWLGDIGYLDRTIDQFGGPATRTPTLALSGANGGEQLDLGVLQALGVTLTGRLERFDGTQALFADDLQTIADEADLQMRSVLDDVDEHIERTRPSWPHPPEPVSELRLAPGPASVDLAAHGISTVVWATGYRREYPWLQVPVFDDRGEIAQRHGVTPVDGLYALGLRFQRRRASNIIGGVGADALLVAQQIADRATERDRRWDPLHWLSFSPRAALVH
jgi:putative flavoprotein involved in K+ transport